jgi:HEAT repeats
MMDLTAVLELFGSEHVAGDEMTAAFLDDAVANFSTNPTGATSAIRQLQSSDPSGFVLAAVQLLTTAHEKSPGMQFIAGLMFAGNLLIDPLLDHRTLHLEAAISLARNLATVEPLLDVRLMRKMLLDAKGDIHSVKPEVALRALSLVEAISDCSRLSFHLTLMMRHTNAEVRSEAALLLSTSSFNLNRTKTFLSSDNSFLRAAMIESMWGIPDPEILSILQQASNDPDRRVRINALIGLTRGGDLEACRRLQELGRSGSPLLGATAAWAAGEIGDAEYAERLSHLKDDSEPRIKALVERRLRKLQIQAARRSAQSGLRR